MDMLRLPMRYAMTLAAITACSSGVSTPSGDNGGMAQAGSTGGTLGNGGKASGAGGSAGSAVAAGRGGSAGTSMMGGGSQSPGGATSVGGTTDLGGSTAMGGTTDLGGSSADGGSMSGGTGGRGGRSSGGGMGSSGGTAGMPAAGTGAVSAAGSGPADPGVGCVAAPTDYPNLFVTLLGQTQADSDAKVAAAWNQLYNPSDANTVFYNGPGSDESYVKDVANNDVRTEGMSYGMMTALQLDHQTEFDRLWAFVKKHMLQSNGQYTWHTQTSGAAIGSGSAPDGDEYFATALIFAAKRWGATTGNYDYAAEAQVVLDMIRKQEFNQTSKIVEFTPGSNFTDGSYVLPAFYQAWACFDTANSDFWGGAVTAARAFFQAAADSNGVIPDHSSFNGQAQGGAGSDAVRCVANVMMDHNFYAADPWQTTYATKYGGYIKSHSNNTLAMTSCNGLLGFGMPEDSGKAFVQSLWSAKPPTGSYRYYDGTLYMLALLHVSGTFKMWY
jgi:oligosaccharide reducing-end xylanase